MMGDSDVPEDPADPAGWLGLADSDGDLRDQVPTGGWVLSHPVMQGTASPTTLHHPRAEGWRIRSAELGSSVCGMRGPLPH